MWKLTNIDKQGLVYVRIWLCVDSIDDDWMKCFQLGNSLSMMSLTIKTLLLIATCYTFRHYLRFYYYKCLILIIILNEYDI